MAIQLNRTCTKGKGQAENKNWRKGIGSQM